MCVNRSLRKKLDFGKTVLVHYTLNISDDFGFDQSEEPIHTRLAHSYRPVSSVG